LQNRELTVEYVSVLAQAQRLVNTGAIERLTAFTGELSAVWPSVRHKINVNKAVDEYAEALGVDPTIMVSDDEAQVAVDAEQLAAQQAATLQQGQAVADMAKTASEAPIEENTVLGKTMKNVGGLDER
jgi:hypothetical protein